MEKILVFEFSENEEQIFPKTINWLSLKIEITPVYIEESKEFLTSNPF